MLPFAPRFLGQILLARHTLGQQGKTVQDLRDLIPKTAVKIPTPITFGDLSVGDYLLESHVSGGTNLLQILKINGHETEFKALGSIGSPREYDVGEEDLFYSTSKISYNFEVYRPSGAAPSAPIAPSSTTASDKGTFILGGLALAAIAGGVIYFSTQR